MLLGRVQTRLAAIAGEKINLAVNTVGPIERTAPQVIDALPSAHYVDVANDPIAVNAVLARGAAASAAGTTLVTCVGFGVIATRSAAVRAVVRAVEVRGPADSLRVDAPTAVASDGRALGEALAATIIDGSDRWLAFPSGIVAIGRISELAENSSSREKGSGSSADDRPAARVVRPVLSDPAGIGRTRCVH